MSTTGDISSFVTARDAASRANVERGFVARLARESRIRARQVGKRWYVDPDSLDAYLAAHGGHAALKKRRTRRAEIPADEPQDLTGAIEEAIAERVPAQTHHAIATSVRHASFLSTPGINMHAASYVVHPGVDLLHRLIALFTVFVIVLGAYGAFDREFGAAAIGAVAYSAGAAAGFAAVVFGAQPHCDSRMQVAAAAAVSSLKSAAISIDNAMPSNLPPRQPAADTGCR